jgi:hypothetical protein
MARCPPELAALDHEDDSAKYVGRTEGGQQFFRTRPFVPAIGDGPGREFIALYLFDPDGGLTEVRFEEDGPEPETARQAFR